MSTKWTTADIPDQSGRVAIITGANTGLGFDTAAALADKGAQVVLAVRNLDKGKDAVAQITAQEPERRRHGATTRPDVAGRDPQGRRGAQGRPPRGSTC